MTSSALQFGPEWMRNKQQSIASTARTSVSLLSPTLPSTSPPVPGASSYSSLLTAAPAAPPEKQDSVNPFLYSKEELLQVWRDGGGHGGLGLEVELWEGVVREMGGEPMGIKEMNEGEKKLFSLPLNSDLRRRQSHDFLPNLTHSTDRPKHSHTNSSTHSPLGQQRFGGLLARKRKDDGNDGGPSLSIPRRLSMSSLSSPLGGPLSPTAGALSSPRNKLGSGSHGLDGLTSPSDGSWRKRETDSARGGILGEGNSVEERDEETGADGDTSGVDPSGSFSDADLSRSVSGRSMAPSPPSFREDSGGHPAPTDDLNTTLSSLALHEGKKSAKSLDVHNSTVDGREISDAKSGILEERPPGLENDTSNVSWSYRDPKGNIQGPFTATLMQKWYDEGYFTSDLLMKRTHLDTDWTPVGELNVRAGKEKLFFSSFSESAPPGLSPRPSIPPIDGLTFDQNGQPLGQIPLQHMHQPPEPYSNGSPLNHFRHSVATRTSTLDSFLASSSNPPHSPASSFGAAGIGIVPIPAASPEPPFGVTGGRTSFGSNVAEPSFSGRVSGFEQQSPSMAARSGNVGFGTSSDSFYGPRLTSLTQRGSMFEVQGFNNLVNPVAPSWATGSGGNGPRNHDSEVLGNLPMHRTSLGNGGFTNSPVANFPGFSESGSQESTQFGSDPYNISNIGFSQPGRGDLSTELVPSSFGPIGLGGLRDQGLRSPQDLESAPINIQHDPDERSMTSGFGNGFGPGTAGHGQGSMFGVHGNQQGLPQQLPSQHFQQLPQNAPPVPTFNQFPAAPSPSSPGNVIQPQQQQSTANIPTASSPWGLPQPSAQPQPGLFDSPHPHLQTPVTPDEVGPYNNQHAQLESTEWYNSSKPERGEGMGDMLRPRPLPANQGFEESKAQQPAWNTPPKTGPAPVDRGTAPGRTASVPLSTPPPPQASPHEPTPHTSAKKRVSPPQHSQSAPSKSSVAPQTVSSTSIPKPPSPRPTTSIQAKPAWSTPVISTDDEAKATKQAGLREIQEAEAKRVEARKLAEREKERAARAHPVHASEDTQAFTASWGLPISQAGTARTIAKEQIPVVVAPLPSTTPVWTSVAKPQQIKRTMKEIQEEEERRKKALAKEKETAAAAARRAYADSATKVASTVPTGGGWTTVGSSGKPSLTPSTPRPVSGSALSAASPQTPVRVANGTLTRASPASSQASKPSSKPATAEEGPVPPSPEFMKWLREAVRGFNAGFNTEEFMAMLLAFSLDFPPSTVEVIQDMVYMNSATLDGRRFAADFCARRKADAANRPNGWGATGGKQPSLADVVKTQPKPAQSELPFKMVKKKGRGNTLR